jgi:altronate dehydratase large subunit
MTSILGFERPSGPAGIRNYLACIFTVECASFVAQKLCEIDSRVQLLGFPGCYGNEYAARLMAALASHPNVGAALLVSLGCEGTDASGLADRIRASGRPVELLRIQELGGTQATIERGSAIVRQLLEQLDCTPRVQISVSDLVVGTECGGSDATSGISANPSVGRAFDMLVDAGGTAIIEETLEAFGCSGIASRRAASPEVAGQIKDAIQKAETYSLKVDQFSIAPGNRSGGLTTIEEKSMGAFSKSGTRPFNGVIKVSQTPPAKGLYLLDTVPDPSPFLFGYANLNDSEGILALLSCGAHLVLFTTGRGSVIGSALAPVLKVCGNPQTYFRMSGDMDINAGRIITGDSTIAETGAEIFDLVLAVASGQQTKAERLGHREYCVPYKYQDFCIAQ